MTGLIYKEWKQNRWYILSMILCGALPLIAYIALIDRIHNSGQLVECVMIATLSAFIAAGILQMMVLNGDDRKLWGYFIASSPDGYRGFLRIKYEMIFFMELLFFTSLEFIISIVCSVAADSGIEDALAVSQSAEAIIIPLVFLQILFRAFDIPFAYRFGIRKGSTVKMICFVLLAIEFTVILILTADYTDVMIDDLKAMLTGEKSCLLLYSVFAGILVMYCISYRITCRLYMKGVEQYDK